MVDLFIGKCSEELLDSSNNEDNGDDNQSLSLQLDVSNQLLSSTQEQSNQLSPVVTNYNGFELKVITVYGSAE